MKDGVIIVVDAILTELSKGDLLLNLRNMFDKKRAVLVVGRGSMESLKVVARVHEKYTAFALF